MRIALFTDTYLPHVNGVARTLARLTRHAIDRGHDVAVVTPQTDKDASDDATMLLQVPSVRLPFYPELRLAGRMNRFAMQRLRSFAPDIVHVATEFTIGWAGVGFAAERMTPLVSSFHTDFPAYLSSYGMSGLEPLAWRYLRAFHERARVNFCPSAFTLEQLRSAGFRGDLRVWSRGVNDALFHPDKRSIPMRLRLGGEAPVLMLYVGRLAGEKRIDLLLQAFARLRFDHGARAHLAIVGEGPDERRLRALAGDGVSFHGYMHGEQLAEAYASADVFAFPSDTETFGNVVLEAAASGLCIVAANRGGVTQTVTAGQSGLLFEAGSVDSLYAALNRTITEPAERRRLARHAREHATRQSWASILDAVLETYAELAERPKTVVSFAS